MPSSLARRICLASLGLSLAFGVQAQNAAPRIRQFDIATLERLGREMYEQDQRALQATDVLFLEHSQAELNAAGFAGWVTSTINDAPAVRFVRLEGREPTALYDVLMPSDGEPTVAQPKSALTAEETAQFRARQLALSGIDGLCADSYNTIALKDPASNNWLVWAMSATTRPDILPAGGHIRYTITTDGRGVLARDALSRGCMNLERVPTDNDDDLPASSFVSHVVSMTPLESHVFLSLSDSLPLHVGTLDGRTWRVADGRISVVTMDSPDLDGFAARRFAGMYEACSAVVSSGGDPPAYQVVAEGQVKVIDPSEADGPLALDIDTTQQPVGVLCTRLEIVPAPRDYKVIEAGLVLYINDTGAGHPPRSGILERVAGQYTFRLINGDPLTPELQAQVDARLASFAR